MKHLFSIVSVKFKELRSAVGKLADRMPALLILVGVINAALPLVLYPKMAWLHVFLFTLPLLVLGAFLLSRFRFFVLLIAVVAGFTSTVIHQEYTAASYVSLLGRCDRGAQVKVKVVDVSCCGNAISWLPNPRLLTAKVLAVKLNASGIWQKTYGKIAVRLPDDCPLVEYGEIITLDGTFRSTENHFLYQKNFVSADSAKQIRYGMVKALAVPGSRQFTDYLKSRNIPRIFYSRKLIENVSGNAGIYAPVLAVRNFMLTKVTEGIKSLKCRNLLATLLFGCRQGLDYEDKADYIKSGTIHIFTVSGLHVGILAVILFWLLRPLSFRKRHLLVPLLVFVYVLSTGMHPPAMRAWLMISIWCVCRAMLLYIPALNIVFLSAALLLLKNPFYLRDMGYQFSFVVVGFLILSSRNIREWEKLAEELVNWIPPKYRNLWVFRLRKWRRKILLSLAGCVVAWLASSGICLYYQGIYFPFSILANFLLIPFVLLLFNLVFVKLLLCGLSFALPLTSFLVENTVRIIDNIAGMSLGIFESTNASVPGFWGLVIFYAALLLLVTARRPWVLITGVAGVMIMICFWHFSGILLKPSLIMLHGGDSQEPAFVIIDPGSDNAVVVNIPSYETGQVIAECLGRNGVRCVDTLIFSGSRKDFCAGTNAFLRSVKVRETIQLTPLSRSGVFRNSLNLLAEQGAFCRYGKTAFSNNELFEFESGNMKIIGKNQRFDIEYRSSSLHINVSAFSVGNGRRKVRLIFEGRGSADFELLNSSVMEIKDYSFGW